MANKVLVGLANINVECQPLPGLNVSFAGYFAVPAANVVNRYIKAVCNGIQGISVANGVAHLANHVAIGTAGGGTCCCVAAFGPDRQGLTNLEAVAGCHVVPAGQLFHAHLVLAGNLPQRIAGTDSVAQLLAPITLAILDVLSEPLQAQETMERYVS